MTTRSAAEADDNDPHQAYLFLRSELPQRFGLEDLKELCTQLGLDYQHLRHDRLGALTDDLLRYVSNHRLQVRFIRLLRDNRSSVAWPDTFLYPTGAPLEYRSEERATSPSLNSNPFGRTGRLLGPPDYLVRRPFTDNVVQELHKGVNLSIVGETQTGKSSLLWYLTRHGPALLGRPAADFIYLDMQLLGDDRDFYDALGDELGIPPAKGYRLGRALRGRNIVLCLDEVEKMTWDGFTIDLRSQLRGLADGPDAPLKLVIASRTPLARLFPDAPNLTSPLAGLCFQMEMRPFTLAETQALVDAYLRGRGLTLPAAAIEAAWQSSEGYPARLQQQLKAAFDREQGGQ